MSWNKCHYCGAEPYTDCLTQSGRPTKEHKARKKILLYQTYYGDYHLNGLPAICASLSEVLGLTGERVEVVIGDKGIPFEVEYAYGEISEIRIANRRIHQFYGTLIEALENLNIKKGRVNFI